MNSTQLQTVMDAWVAVGIYSPYIGPHAASVSVIGNYHRPGLDTVQVLSRINNPDNHNLQVEAIITSLDLAVTDTIDMYDDGMHHDSTADDNIYGGSWPVVSGERFYSIQLNTLSVDSGNFNILRNAAYFTTSGPLKVDHYNVPWLSGNVVPVELFARNDGLVMDAADVYLELSSSDSTVVNIAPSNRNTIDISAGDTVKTPPTYFIYTVDSPEKINLDVLIYSAGNPYWSDQIVVDVLALDIGEQEKTVPIQFSLSQNYPNPFNPSTKINYELPITNDVNLSIYNLLGQKVATLVNEQKQAGSHQVAWDASGFPSGVYYYRIEAGEFQDVKKMILLK
jgi:hypothetical protein